MPTILIVTDFSAASRHALQYACLLLKDKSVTIDLLHIFPVPVTYTAEGLALAAIEQAIAHAEEHLEGEIAEVAGRYPEVEIKGRVITGSFLETLRQEVKDIRPMFMILGTTGFGDIYLGDEDPLEALRRIPAPVLFVPQGAPLQPIRQVAFASNYAFAGPRIPVREIRAWVGFMEADMQVVHTDAEPQGASEKQRMGEAWLREQLEPLNPKFNWVQDESVIRGLSGFISANNIDCVLVVPRRYGFWQNFLHHSRTKALARLNKVPVIAFHELV
jgi:nucleotide-binding universal stress UspA family protein